MAVSGTLYLALFLFLTTLKTLTPLQPPQLLRSSSSSSSSKKVDKATADKKDTKGTSNSSKKPEDKKDLKDKDGKKDDHRSSSSHSSKSRKRPGDKDANRTVIMDKSKGEPVISLKTSSKDKDASGKANDKRSTDKSKPKDNKSEVLSFDKIRQERDREKLRAMERRMRDDERRKEHERRERRDRERLRILHEREERERVQRERTRLQVERVQLEKERLECERIERERMRIEQERRREQERIVREREELRRQQEQLRIEQERHAALKRPFEVDSRRDDGHWGDAKRLALDSDVSGAMFVRGADVVRSDARGGETNRFHDYDHRERARFTDGHGLTVPGIERRVEQYDRRDSRALEHSMGRREEQPVFSSGRFASTFESRGSRDAAPSAVPRRGEVRDTRDRDERRMDMGRDRVSAKARDPTQRTHSSPHDSPRRATVREEWKGERSVVTDRRDTRLVEKQLVKWLSCSVPNNQIGFLYTLNLCGRYILPQMS
uniref:SAFB-like transcription modulator n=1 Tax=Myxine glutinosa TaxID=7769 RepID=UPI00358EC48A